MNASLTLNPPFCPCLFGILVQRLSIVKPAGEKRGLQSNHAGQKRNLPNSATWLTVRLPGMKPSVKQWLLAAQTRGMQRMTRWLKFAAQSQGRSPYSARADRWAKSQGALGNKATRSTRRNIRLPHCPFWCHCNFCPARTK